MPKKYISENAELMKEWNWERNKDLDPNRLSMACAIKVWWKCSKCGYEWKTAINKRTYRKHGCLNCSGQVAFPGVNDLATLYPEVAKEWHPTKNAPLTPREVRPKSNKNTGGNVPNADTIGRQVVVAALGISQDALLVLDAYLNRNK